jgi:hypothetical protein
LVPRPASSRPARRSLALEHDNTVTKSLDFGFAFQKPLLKLFERLAVAGRNC